MRASRLVQLLGLLQDHGRLTTSQLATQLEVSQRTVLRDIEALSSAGVPVYGVRGSQGGFELIEGFSSDLPSARLTPKTTAPAAARARIWLSPRGRRLAILLGRPAGLKIRKTPGHNGWVQAWIPVDSPEATVLDILALGAEAELIAPPELRAMVRDTAERIARLHTNRDQLYPPKPDARRHRKVLKFPLIHPPLLAALGAAGHGARVLLADSNYSHSTNIHPGATLIHLNLRPGLVTVEDVLEPVLASVPLEAVAVMRPDDGSTPAVFSRYEELLGPDLPLQPLDRQDFYAACREPTLAACVATGDSKLYANILLTIGYIRPE